MLSAVVAVVFFAILVSALVNRWLFGKGDGLPNASGPRAALAGALAGYDLPSISHRLFGVPPDRQTTPLIGLKHAAIMTALGLTAISVLSAGLSSRSIQHGQVCFIIAAGVCISGYLSDIRKKRPGDVYGGKAKGPGYRFELRSLQGYRIGHTF